MTIELTFEERLLAAKPGDLVEYTYSSGHIETRLYTEYGSYFILTDEERYDVYMRKLD